MVFAPIHRTDKVVATPPASFVRVAAKAQRVAAIPCIDAVGTIIAVDSVIIGGACKGVRSLIALDRSR